MKNDEKNLQILKQLGFSCDYERTKYDNDKEWFSLSNGWGFCLPHIRHFRSLCKRLQSVEMESFLTKHDLDRKELEKIVKEL